MQNKEASRDRKSMLKQVIFVVLVAIIVFALVKRRETEEDNKEATIHIAQDKSALEEYDPVNTQRQQAVKSAFLHAWRGYDTYSFGHDELRPCTNNSRDNFAGFGATIIDAMDTMLIMGLREEFEKCRDFVTKLDFNKDEFVSLFEVTIRLLGGLLSTFELTRDELFLTKAVELANRLLPAFSTKSGIPYTLVNLATGDRKNQKWHHSESILSEIGSLQLEFKYLSFHTGNPVFARRVDTVMQVLRAKHNKHYPGLYTNYIQTETGNMKTSWYSLGALGDSFYEYLLKQYLLTSDSTYYTMYRESVQSIKKHMLAYSEPNKFAYIAEFKSGLQVPKFDHLVCYVPGMLALGSMSLKDVEKNATLLEEDLHLAKEIMRTCVHLYIDQESGLGPEIANFSNKTHDYNVQHPTYLLRPEVVESLFVLYRVTGDDSYREYAWRIFNSIERACKTPAGYSGVTDVTKTNPPFDNAMESFFLSETLKYLYLIFSPNNLIPLDEFVLNTEAHPLRPFSPNW